MEIVPEQRTPVWKWAGKNVGINIWKKPMIEGKDWTLTITKGFLEENVYAA